MTIPVKSGIVSHYYGVLMHIQFDKPYCVLQFTKGRKYWVEVSIQEVLANLPEAVFLKCKRSAIINLCYLKSFHENPPTIEMADGVTFSLSKHNVLEYRMMTKRLDDLAPPCPICYPCTDKKCKSQALLCRKSRERDDLITKT